MPITTFLCPHCGRRVKRDELSTLAVFAWHYNNPKKRDRECRGSLKPISAFYPPGEGRIGMKTYCPNCEALQAELDALRAEKSQAIDLLVKSEALRDRMMFLALTGQLGPEKKSKS